MRKASGSSKSSSNKKVVAKATLTATTASSVDDPSGTVPAKPPSAAYEMEKARKERETETERSLEEELFGATADEKSIAKKVAEINEIDRKTSKSAKGKRGRGTVDDNDSRAKKAPAALKSAWRDDDDDGFEVDLNATDRTKKLKKDPSRSKVNATEYAQLLNERYQSRSFGWLKSSSDEQTNDATSLSVQSLMHSSGGFLAKGSRRNLSSGKIDVMRLIDANINEPSKENILSVKFHPGGDLLLAAGEDKFMRLFKIDGDKNEKVLGVKFSEMSISNACFRNSSSSSSSGSSSGSGCDEVIISGRKPYFYTFDLRSGKSTKIPGLMGRGLKSHESMCVSPGGGKIAFAGAAGYTHICDGRTKTWFSDVKMNSSVRSLAFVDETTLLTSGLDANVYVWDLRMSGNGRCLRRFAHEDGTCSSSLAVCPASSSSSYIAVGAESGVVSVYNEILKGYDSDSTVSGAVKPIRSIMNLRTIISSIAFHPLGEVMAIASEQQKDLLKLVHLPSCTVFSNWPTEKTPFSRVKCIDFSSHGGFMAVGNNKGKVLLYQLNHYK